MGFKPAAGADFNPLMKFPRNSECFCGSEIKFKKCCLNNLPVCLEDKFIKMLGPFANKIKDGTIRLKKETA